MQKVPGIELNVDIVMKGDGKMEKIQLTQEQADVIERKKNKMDFEKSNIVECHVKSRWEFDENLFLNKLSTDELCRLLYTPNSYEVIPQYKVEDWISVFRENGDFEYTARITSVESEFVRVNTNTCHDFPQYLNGYNVVKRATDEEITKEKKRQFWEKLGREVDEYKDDDLVVTKWGDFGFIDMSEEDICVINRYPVILLKDSSIACRPADELRLVVKPEDRLDK